MCCNYERLVYGFTGVQLLHICHAEEPKLNKHRQLQLLQRVYELLDLVYVPVCTNCNCFTLHYSAIPVCIVPKSECTKEYVPIPPICQINSGIVNSKIMRTQ